MQLTVQDHIDVEQLSARYNQAFDLGEPEAWAACFTDDGEFSVQPGGEWTLSRGMDRQTFKGQSQLLAFARAASAVARTRHWSSNRVLSPGDEVLRAKSYMTMFHFGGPWADQLFTAIMHDELVKTERGWRFRSRQLCFDR